MVEAPGVIHHLDLEALDPSNRTGFHVSSAAFNVIGAQAFDEYILEMSVDKEDGVATDSKLLPYPATPKVVARFT